MTPEKGRVGTALRGWGGAQYVEERAVFPELLPTLPSGKSNEEAEADVKWILLPLLVEFLQEQELDFISPPTLSPGVSSQDL